MPLNNVPQAGQTLAATQQPINDNFANIVTSFVVDHVDYNINNTGKHNKVTLPIQGTSPASGFLAGEDGFFNFVNAITGIPETHIVKQNFSASSPGYTSAGAIPMTSSTLSLVANPTVLNPSMCFTYLPSGMIVTFGIRTATNPDTFNPGGGAVGYNAILWTAAFLYGSNTLGVTVNAQVGGSGIAVNILNSSGGGATATYAWIAIGY